VYFPSLFHAPKADQITFLAEIVDRENIGGVIAHTYSFNRTREFLTGDEWLFRPLFFLTLVLEKFIFEYDYFFWQLTGLILHLLIVWQLLKLLSSLKPGFFAFVSSLFFSVLTVSQSMVIWHHAHGYLLGIFFLLCSLNIFIAHVSSNGAGWNRLPLLSFYLTITVLCYEPSAILCALLIFIYILKSFWQKHPWERIYPFVIHAALPIVIYATWYCLDLTMHKTLLAGTKIKNASFQAISAFFTILGKSLIGPFMPFQITMDPECKLRSVWKNVGIVEQILSIDNIFFKINFVLAVVSIGALLYIVIILVKNRKKTVETLKQNISENKASLWVSVICITFNGTLLALVSILRGGSYIDLSLYHYYPIVLFHIISLYSLYSIFCGMFTDQRKFYVLIVLIMTSTILFNSARSFWINDLIRQKDNLFFRIQSAVGIKNMYRSDRFFLIAVTAYENGDQSLKLEHLNMALSINPYHLFALIERGFLFYDRLEYKRAFEDFSKAIRVNPNSARAYTGRAIIYRQVGQMELAVRDFSTAIRFGSRLSEAYNNRGYLYLDLKQYYKALKDLSMAIKIDPNNVTARMNRSLLYSKLGYDGFAAKDRTAALRTKSGK
jgi:tetratricopeptide (TPR) repeat protein